VTLSFVSFTKVIKTARNESARVHSQKKLFPPPRSNRRADSPTRGVREGNRAETALARASGSPHRPFGFVVKMYGPNVAQGWEQYSLKNQQRRLDIGGVLM
jgi:hypothetical protein